MKKKDIKMVLFADHMIIYVKKANKIISKTIRTNKKAQ